MAAAKVRKWFRYKVFFPALARLPRFIGYRLANLIGLYDSILHPHRHLVRQGMTRLLTDSAGDPANINRQCRLHYKMLARDTLDCFLMPCFTAENCRRFIRVHNPELLKQARKPGRGVIMVISHFGRFFMLGPGLCFAGINFAMLTTVVDERHPTYDAIDRWYMSTKLHNTQFFSGGSWITTADDPRKIYRSLRSGEILLIALDGNETNSSERFEQQFLGGTLSLPGSIIRIAKTTGARLVYAVTKDSDYGCGVEISFHDLPCQPEDALALSVRRLEDDLREPPISGGYGRGSFLSGVPIRPYP